jgi:hypothetical protein
MRLAVFFAQSLFWLLIAPSHLFAQPDAGVASTGAAPTPGAREGVAIWELDFVIVSIAAGVVVTLALVYLIRKMVPEA